MARLEILKDDQDINYQPTPMDTVGALIAQLNTPLSIYAGYELLRRMAGEPGMIRKARNLAIPFLTAVVYAFTIGGRNPIAANIKLYLLGMGFAAIYHMPRGVYQKFMRYALAVIVAFGLFSTFVADSRSKAFGTETRKALYSSSTMARFSGVIDYSRVITSATSFAAWTGFTTPRPTARRPSTAFSRGCVRLGPGFSANRRRGSNVVNAGLAERRSGGFRHEHRIDLHEQYHDFGHYGTYVFILLIIFYQRCFEGYLSRRICDIVHLFLLPAAELLGFVNFSSSFMSKIPIPMYSSPL
ncbi:MAG: hypothetical protein ACLS37_11380 [Alistipes sp.]